MGFAEFEKIHINVKVFSFFVTKIVLRFFCVSTYINKYHTFEWRCYKLQHSYNGTCLNYFQFEDIKIKITMYIKYFDTYIHRYSFILTYIGWNFMVIDINLILCLIDRFFPKIQYPSSLPLMYESTGCSHHHGYLVWASLELSHFTT